MPLQNPFSPSRIRRRLSRETVSSGNTSPERIGKSRRHYEELIEKNQSDGSGSPGKGERKNSPSRVGRAFQQRGGRDDSTSPKRHSRDARPPPEPKRHSCYDNSKESVTSPRRPHRPQQNSSHTVSPALPYSKDFGSFDLTLCEADDGKCIVLVEYEDRVFLNGKQIYIMLNGTVTDRDGTPNKVLQEHYECVLQEKRGLRKDRNNTPSGGNTARGKHNCGLTSGQDRRGESRGALRDNSPLATPKGRPILHVKSGQIPSKNERRHLLPDFLELESSFSTIIASLCEAVLKYSSRGKDRKTDDSFSDENISCQVQATLRRLIDQFQSVVDLNSSLREKDDVNDDEEIIEKWVAEAFCEKGGGEKSNEKEDEVRQEEPQVSSGLTEKSRKRNVGTQVKEKSAVKVDKNEQTDKKSFENDKLIKELKDENRLLRNEIVAMETDMREMQKLHLELEKRFDEENNAKIEVMKQLQEMTDGSWRKEPADTTNRIEEVTQTEVDIPAAQHVTRSTTSFATCTISSVSLSSVSSTDSEPLSIPDGKEPSLCIRQRSRALKSEIGRLRDVYSDVEDQLSRLAEDNKDLRLRIARLNREGKELKNQVGHATQTCEEYKMEIKNLDKVNTELEAKLSEVGKEKTFIGEQLKRANEELSEVDVDRRKAKRELTDLMKRFKALTEEKSHLSEEFGKLEKAHLEESTKAAKLTKITAESEVQLGILRGQVGDMTVEINQLRAENQTNSEARQRAERDLRKVESDLRATRKVNSELSAEVMHTKSKLGSLEDTLRHLESENAALTQQTVHLEAAKDALTKRAAEAEANIHLMTSNNKELVTESYRLKKENLELRTAVEEMNMVNTNIRTQLDNWGKDSADIGKRMKQLAGVKTELQSFIRQLTSVNVNIEKRFEKMDSEYENLERRLQSAGKSDEDGTTSMTGDIAAMCLQEID